MVTVDMTAEYYDAYSLSVRAARAHLDGDYLSEAKYYERASHYARTEAGCKVLQELAREAKDRAELQRRRQSA